MLRKAFFLCVISVYYFLKFAFADLSVKNDFLIKAGGTGMVFPYEKAPALRLNIAVEADAICPIPDHNTVFVKPG